MQPPRAICRQVWERVNTIIGALCQRMAQKRQLILILTGSNLYLSFYSSSKGEFTVPSSSMSQMFPSIFQSSFVVTGFSRDFIYPSFFCTEKKCLERYYNRDIWKILFFELFLNFVATFSTTLKWDPSDITLTWQLWNGTTEMLFNHDGSQCSGYSFGEDVKFTLLERCEWAFFPFFSPKADTSLQYQLLVQSLAQ